MGDGERKKKRYCSVPECKCNDSEPLIFHRFPRDEEAKLSWKSVCKVSKDISVHMFVCSRHFRQEDYVSDQDAKVQRLKKGTIPSQNLPKDLPKLVPCELPTIAGVKRKRAREDSIIPFQNEIDSILRTMTNEKIEEIQTTLISSENGVKRKCYIPQCTTKPTDNRFYHYFPKNNKVRQQWINVCGLQESVKPYMSVCSAHFRPNDYLISPESNKPMLKPQAIPSQNVPNACKSQQMDSETIKDKQFFQNSKIITQENADTIIYTANNANDLINFIENYNESSDDYLKDSDIITEGLAGVPDFHLPDGNLDLFEEQNSSDEAANGSQNKPSSESNGNASLPHNMNLSFSTDISDMKNPCDKSDSKNVVNSNASQRSRANKIIVKKSESVSMIIKRNGKKNIIIRQNGGAEANGRQASRASPRPGLASTSLCAECGQQCRIEDAEQLDGAKKSPEALAVQILLELRALEPASESEHLVLVRKGLEICDRVLQKETVRLMDLLTEDSELKAFTGISFGFLDKLARLVSLYEGNNQAFKHFDCARDRIVMCLCKIRTDLSFCCLAMLFGVRQQVFFNYFFTMARTLSVLLEKTIHWQRPEELAKNLPAHFQAFKQARVLLSCSEMLIEKKKCQKCRGEARAAERSCESVKLVLGLSLSGLIIFKSDVFKGQRSAGSIFSQTNILGHLDPSREAVMTDKTLDIETECAERNISLIKLPKPGTAGSSELELAKNMFAASFHIDRALQRFKAFQILRNKISWRILPYVNDICTIVVGVVNMNNVIPPDDARLQLSFLR